MSGPNLSFRQPSKADAALLCGMVRQQAADAGDEDWLFATEDRIASNLLGHPEAIVCRILEDASDTVGFLIAYPNYWVYSGARGLYLEALYVRADLRNKGYARAAMTWLRHYARDNGLEFMTWLGGAENDRARGFYAKMGADRSEHWRLYWIKPENL